MEPRRLLTSTLYIDYGDNFPNGVLTTTVGKIVSTVSGKNPSTNGPNLLDQNGANLPSNTSVRIESHSDTINGSAAAAKQFRKDVLAIVKRIYVPFDVDVVELTSDYKLVNDHLVRAASSLADISKTLGANESDSKNNDSYLLVGEYLVGPDKINVADGYGYVGLSPVDDANNSNDNLAISTFNGLNANARDYAANIAHEAGHAFGFPHSYRTTAPIPIFNTTSTPAQYDLMAGSDIMSYNSSAGFPFFYRYPTMLGDGNKDANVLNVATTEYDQLVNATSIGPRYVSFVGGTGAHDVITVRNLHNGTALVTVIPYSDTKFKTPIDAPGQTASLYSYTVPLNRAMVIDAGNGDDRIRIDGDLKTVITVLGNLGTDSLEIAGNGAATALVTVDETSTVGLDKNSDLRARISVGTTLIYAQEFETNGGIFVKDVDTLTYRTGEYSQGGSDKLDVNNTDYFSSKALKITGTDNAKNLVPVIVTGVQNLAINTGIFDKTADNDLIKFGAASDLQSLQVLTGPGNDKLRIDFSKGIPLTPGKAIDYFGSKNDSREDNLELVGGKFKKVNYYVGGSDSGAASYDLNTITYSGLQSITDTSLTQITTVNGSAINDDFNIYDGPVGTYKGITISSLTQTFPTVSVAGPTSLRIQGQGGADTFELKLFEKSVLGDLSLYGEDLNNIGDDNAADSFTFVTSTPASSATYAYGGGGNDLFDATASKGLIRLDGQGGNDQFKVYPSKSGPITVVGGTGSDRLQIASANNYTVNPSSLVSDVTAPVNFGSEVEILAGTAGTYHVDANVKFAIEAVGENTTVVGTGNVAGGLTLGNDATLIPGTALSPDGTISAGGLLLGGAGHLRVALGDPVSASSGGVNVTGGVVLGNSLAKLELSLGDRADLTVPGDAIVIIRNDGIDAVVGRFAGLPQGAIIDVGGILFTIDYRYRADVNGIGNDVALIRYGAAIGVDPSDINKPALYVSGSAADDQISIVQGRSGFTVVLNGKTTFFTELSPDTPVFVHGQNGDDRISFDGTPGRFRAAYGGDGNDNLTTSNGSAVLFGGAGNDTLVGSQLADLLIGGFGADTLSGDGGNDGLIAGTTAIEDYLQLANRAVAISALSHLASDGPQAVQDFLPVIERSDLLIDRLTGGAGSDAYVGELTPGLRTTDVITDLEDGEAAIDV